MKKETLALAYIPCASIEEAKEVAHQCILQGLAFCANILPEMHSYYPWEGKMEESKEVVLLLKHLAKDFEKLKTQVEDLHSYETPCIAQISASDCNVSYLQWGADWIQKNN